MAAMRYPYVWWRVWWHCTRWASAFRRCAWSSEQRCNTSRTATPPRFLAGSARRRTTTRLDPAAHRRPAAAMGRRRRGQDRPGPIAPSRSFVRSALLPAPPVGGGALRARSGRVAVRRPYFPSFLRLIQEPADVSASLTARAATSASGFRRIRTAAPISRPISRPSSRSAARVGAGRGTTVDRLVPTALPRRRVRGPGSWTFYQDSSAGMCRPAALADCAGDVLDAYAEPAAGAT
jgi:hypothetical protein